MRAPSCLAVLEPENPKGLKRLTVIVANSVVPSRERDISSRLGEIGCVEVLQMQP